MRIFAGPNGSGKSTIIQAVREYRIKEIPIDFGIYINADDIAQLLRSNQFRFSDYRVNTSRKEFSSIAISSGLIGSNFPEKTFRSSFILKRNQQLLIKDRTAIERLAQILSDFLRKKLLQAGKKFSFETVFSHPSKLEIMHEAKHKGYKVYLYFVSTESPEINIYRVQVRKDKGGHDVPASKIRSRYDRALDLMFEASQLAYQAYFFDNSGEQPKLFAHFKSLKGKKKWDKIKKSEVPGWFKKYYSAKVR